MFYGCRRFMLMAKCKEVGEVYVEGSRRASAHDGLFDVGWLCVYKLGSSLVKV
jgi:hypothetical protein